MCHKLLQVYACGHPEEVCTTPCPHAIDTGSRITQIHNDQGLQNRENSNSSSVLRSSSAASSIAPSVRRGVWQGLPSQRSPGHSLPQRMGAGLDRQTGSPPAFHFVPPDQNPRLASPPGHPQPSPTSPTIHSPELPSPGSAPSSRPSQMLPISPSFMHLPEEERAVEPNYCAYYFPRYLPRSLRPCVQCYMQPKWEDQRRVWMAAYRTDHPMVKSEDVEQLSGIATVRERDMKRGPAAPHEALSA